MIDIYSSRKGLFIQVIANDLKNCYEAIANDELLQSLERDFYSFRDGMDASDFTELEETFSVFVASGVENCKVVG